MHRLLVIAFAGALIAGCQPDPADTMSNPTLAALHESRPLPLDPTAPVVVEGWWSNGRQLLHLADDSGYRLWSTTNRFDLPLQTGRWSRLSYAAVELQPYGTRVPERTRCDLEMSGTEVRLVIEGVDPMVRFDRAPATLEDRLVGAWRGAGGTLRLDPEGRYRADAPTSSASQPIALAGHGGRWLVEKGSLLLVPDSPSVPVVMLAVEASGVDEVLLRAGDGAYTRVVTQ